MEKKIRSILDELTDYAPSRDRDLFIESRAQQVVASFANLVRLIEENYSTEDAEDLTRRLLLSVKNGDPAKFSRKIRVIRESRKR